MDDRAKVRRGLGGLLLAFVLSALLWGAIIAMALVLRPPAPGTAWWQLPWVRNGAVVALIAIIALAAIGEIARIRTRRRLARTESAAPWPIEERQPEHAAPAHRPAGSHAARKAEPAGDRQSVS